MDDLPPIFRAQPPASAQERAPASASEGADVFASVFRGKPGRYAERHEVTAERDRLQADDMMRQPSDALDESGLALRTPVDEVATRGRMPGEGALFGSGEPGVPLVDAEAGRHGPDSSTGMAGSVDLEGASDAVEPVSGDVEVKIAYAVGPKAAEIIFSDQSAGPAATRGATKAEAPQPASANPVGLAVRASAPLSGRAPDAATTNVGVPTGSPVTGLPPTDAVAEGHQMARAADAAIALRSVASKAPDQMGALASAAERAVTLSSDAASTGADAGAQMDDAGSAVRLSRDIAANAGPEGAQGSGPAGTFGERTARTRAPLSGTDGKTSQPSQIDAKTAVDHMQTPGSLDTRDTPHSSAVARLSIEISKPVSPTQQAMTDLARGADRGATKGELMPPDAPQMADARATTPIPTGQIQASPSGPDQMKTALNKAAATAALEGDGAKLDVTRLGPDIALTGGPTSANSSSAMTSAVATSSHASAVAQQVAAFVRDQGFDPRTPLDLALDPPELGRLRMSVTEIGGALTLTIMAERPETADLMRRHMALLSEEFARAGVDAPQVNISHGDGQSSQDNSAAADQGVSKTGQDAAPAERAETGRQNKSDMNAQDTALLDLRL
ncbi:MAG: flagellar hook-length control protein FliK [Pseudomonadota bacterium]